MNEMQFPVCAPCVKEHMLKPKYWVEQVEDAEDLIALIARYNDINEDYLPYTRENIVRQAFKSLGERYG